jgi:hypothetical protein
MGCSSTINDQRTNSNVPITATSIQTLPPTTISVLPTLIPQQPNAIYEQGDIIQKSSTDTTYDRYVEWVIIQVNNDGTYLVGQIYYDRNENKWWKSNEEIPQIKLIGFIDSNFPELIGKINWDNIPTKYTYKDCEGIVKYSWTPQPDCDIYLSPTVSSPIYSSSGSGPTIFNGYGDDVVSFNAQGTGLRIFNMRYTGGSNFIVVLKDNQGNWVDLLANKIGSYSGKKSAQLNSGTYYLDVTASGPWTIEIYS